MPDVDLESSTGHSNSPNNFSFSLRQFALAILLASIPLAAFGRFGAFGVFGGVAAAMGLFCLTLSPKDLTVGLVVRYSIYMSLFPLLLWGSGLADGRVRPAPYLDFVLAIVLASAFGGLCCAIRLRFPGGRKL